MKTLPALRGTVSANRRKEVDKALRRVLHLIADSAIAADDALDRGDFDSLGKAADALGKNNEFAQKLALTFCEATHV